jgi:hypothetical protein
MAVRKILIGLGAAVVVLAAAGYAGAEWLRYRAEREIEATFAAIRTSVGPASYGRAHFDPWTRTIRISDIALQANRNVAPPTRIGELVLAGVPLFPRDRITARQVNLTRAEIAGTGAKSIRIDGVTIDDVDVSRAIDWQRLRVLAEAGSGPPASVPQPKDVLPVVAEMLEGIRFGRLEMRDLAFREGAGGVDLATVRIEGFADGRFAELTMRDVRSVALPDKVNFGRVALKKLDLAGLLRKSARLSAASRSPTPDEIGELFNALEGFEMDDVDVPDRRLDRTSDAVIHFRSMQVSWGRIVGTLPTTAHYAVKAEIPLGNEYGEPFQALRDAGRKSLAVGFDISSTWTEQTRALVLSPATFEFDTLFSASLTLSIANFSPTLLANDPVKTALAASVLEAGPVELSVHDSGGLDFTIAQAAKTQGLSASAARAKMVSDLQLGASMQPRQSPEFQRLVDELARFLAGDGSTLKIRLTPKGRVNLMQLMELAKTDPIGALSRFGVETSLVAQ